eukprot:11327813-Alexandrium_andersonii.AAC.1
MAAAEGDSSSEDEPGVTTSAGAVAQAKARVREQAGQAAGAPALDGLNRLLSPGITAAGGAFGGGNPQWAGAAGQSAQGAQTAHGGGGHGGLRYYDYRANQGDEYGQNQFYEDTDGWEEPYDNKPYQ